MNITVKNGFSNSLNLYFQLYNSTQTTYSSISVLDVSSGSSVTTTLNTDSSKGKILIIYYYDQSTYNFGIFQIMEMSNLTNYNITLLNSSSTNYFVKLQGNDNIYFTSNNINNFVKQSNVDGSCNQGYNKIGTCNSLSPEYSCICVNKLLTFNFTIVNNFGKDIKLYYAIYDSSGSILNTNAFSVKNNESIMRMVYNNSGYIQMIFLDSSSNNYGLFQIIRLTNTSYFSSYKATLTNNNSNDAYTNLLSNGNVNVKVLLGNINNYVSLTEVPNYVMLGNKNTSDYIWVNNIGLEDYIKSNGGGLSIWWWIIIGIIAVIVFVVIICIIFNIIKKSKNKDDDNDDNEDTM